MTAFRYVVRDANGRTLRGVMEMQDRASILSLFREQRYHIVSVDSATVVEVAFQRILDQFSGIKRENIVLFTRQLSTLVRSGLPLAQALESLALQERNPKFQAIIGTIKDDIEKGKPFSEALARYRHLFSHLFIGMVQAGESAGILADVLERLSRLGLQELEIRTKLRAAFTYPVILVGVAMLVLGFL
ncbi:MAG: type II secretion system F family protein, partial [Candidatus Omnitrophica bacterium]|nr:type II secretion system F family protein [Candidatus Omnitrophota bacterium]